MSDHSDNRSADYEAFLRYFTQDQLRIHAYIRSLLHDPVAASDVFQETSLELWRSFPTFRRDTEFAPWALGVARNQLLKHWRTRDRDRHVFSDTLLKELSAAAINLTAESAPRQQAMEECVSQLSARQQELIHLFYGESLPADFIAQQWNRSVHTVYKALKVMRRSLMECVESRMARESL